MKNKKIKTKTVVISHKVRPETKNLLVQASIKEDRSQANMLEVIISEYCKNHNIAISYILANNKEGNDEQKS